MLQEFSSQREGSPVGDNGLGSNLSALADGAQERHDLFIGFVAPIGSSKKQVVDALTKRLKPNG